MMPPRDAEPEPPRGVPYSVSRSVWRAATWTGVVAAVLGAAMGVSAAVICWLPDAGVSGHPLSAIRAGLLSFLAAQHGGMTIDGTSVGFVPLGMPILVAVIAWRAGSVLAEVARLVNERRPGTIAAAGALQAACYAAACTVLVPLASLGATAAPLIGVGVAGFLLFSCVTGASLCRSPVLREWWAVRVPAIVADGGRAAAGAVAVYLGSGAVLVAASLIVHGGRVTELSRLVGGGVSGVPIALFGALSAPNAAVAGASYLAGPGFAVGSGTSVNAFSTSHGTLPAFPLLGALPAGHGASAPVFGWLAATLLAAGYVVVRLVVRDDLGDAIRGAAVAAPAAGGAMAVLAWLAGGRVGAHRLSAVGPSPWQVGFAVAGELAGVALPVLGGWWLWRRITASGGKVEPAPVDEPELVRTAT